MNEEGREMTTIQKCKMPGIAIIGIGLTLMNTWVLFEETVVDRFGLHKFMPLYQVGKPCIWDLAAVAVISMGGIWIWKLQKPSLKGNK
jgi:hypothetical protein